MNIFLWLIAGGVIGWLASRLMGTGSPQGLILDTVVGIIGAVLAGWFISPILGASIINQNNFSLPALFVSLLGAVALLALVMCFIGGAVKLIPAILSAVMPESGSIESLVFYSGIIAFPLLMAGPLGLHRQGAFGNGGIARIGVVGVVIALLGLSLYLGNYLLGPAPMRTGVAAMSTASGMTVLGVAVWRARGLNGWRLYAPIGAGLAYFIQVIPQILFRLIQGQAKDSLIRKWGVFGIE